MEFKIDTSRTGPVPAAELRAALEKARDYWCDSQASAAGLQASATHGPGPDGKSDPQGALDHMKKVQAAAAPLVDAHKAKTSSMRDLMDHGIDQACATVELYLKRAKAPEGATLYVSATVEGHHDRRHASGCEHRFSVKVDHTWTKLAGED